jgi:hypothetical protein
MTRRGVDWQMHVYGGVGHSFTNRWQSMLDLFNEAFSSHA